MTVASAEYVRVLEANHTALVKAHEVLWRVYCDLKTDNERYKKALEFYADPGTYHACAFWFDSPTGGFDEDFDEDHGDEFYDREMPGKLARAALAGAVVAIGGQENQK